MPRRLELRRRARARRLTPGLAQRMLWSRLRRSGLGPRFSYQHVLYPYVVDFYCPSHGIAIVIEAGADGRRSPGLEAWAERVGVEIVRLSAPAVVVRTDEALCAIRAALTDEEGEVGDGARHRSSAAL